jgi:hypothetical protein
MDALKENEILRERLKAANEVLRSAHSIAVREGKDTNWRAFLEKVKAEIVAEHEIVFEQKVEV